MAAIERKEKNMKKQWKKTAALVMTLMLGVSLLSACGGSGGSGGSGSDAEANAGVRGVVITVPDGWTVNGGTGDGNLTFGSEDSDYTLSINATNSADLENNKKYDDSVKTTDVEEYYKQNSEKYDKSTDPAKPERSETKVCGTDGYYYKMKNDNSYIGLEVTWLMDDNIYDLYLSNWDNYDMENNGELKKDAKPLSDDEIAMFESVVASAKAGDGAALQKKLMKADSVGKYSFETPEGYETESFGENYVSLKKDGSDVTLQVNITTEEDLKYIEDENGKHPASLEEEWSNRSNGLGDENKTEIAGREAVLYEFPDENGKMYNVSATFLSDDGLYNISMDTQAWDESGKLREDAKALTKDEIETFENFLKTFKAR